jgi:hypothetical protein
MSSHVWQRRLDAAMTSDSVVLVVNEFLILWTPDELARLPLDCAPGRFNTSEQVKSYALKLARRHMIGEDDASALHRMATFFTRAALRIFKINEQPSEADADRRESGRGGS